MNALGVGALALAAAAPFLWRRLRRNHRRRCLALALGGSSDVIGALALAAASGYEQVIILQPGSPPKGVPPPDAATATKVSVNPGMPLKAPGGNYFDNPSMIVYLLQSCKAVVAGYYLTQPTDEAGGFSKASLEATTNELQHIAKEHAVDAIVALDFGGDVALPEPANTELFIAQRDMLNLRAAAAVAHSLRIDALFVAAAPGVDAAAVSPEYMAAVGNTAVRTLKMNRDGELVELQGPTPACTLSILPDVLFKRRLPPVIEHKFCAELRTLTNRILKDAALNERHEHTSKTYCMMAAVAAEVERYRANGDTKEFVALGQFRDAEQARAHLHSADALGLYDISSLTGEVS